MKKFTRIFKPFSSVLLILVILAGLIIPFVSPSTVWATDWYNGNWDYRISFTISRASGAVTDYQFPLKIYYGSGTSGTESVEGITAGKLYCDSKCQADFDDIRVTADDGTTLLDYWVETETDSTSEVIWIEFDSIGTSATTFYVYYGYGSATSVSSGADTFIDYDDFERDGDTDPVGGDWTASGSCTISTDHAYGGTRSAKIAKDAYMNIPLTADSGTYEIRYRCWKEDAAGTIYTLMHGDNSYRGLVTVATTEDIYNNAIDTGSNTAADTWRLWQFNDFNFTAHTLDIKENASSVLNDGAMNAAGGSLDHVRVYNASASAGQDFYIDNYIVRNWRSTEPAFGSWGSEEEAPTVPIVTTSDASSVEETTATTGGNITDIGGSTPTVRGVEYDTDSGAPYAQDSHESGSFGTGAFTRDLTGLTQGELYYFRAYATNGAGTGYGTEKTFLTKPIEPDSFTASYGSSTSIQLNWNKGTGAQNTVIRGKEDSYPTDIADGIEVYNNTGTSYEHTGLTEGEHWYYRAWSYATEGALEQYSDTYDEDNFTVVDYQPDVTTLTCTGFRQDWAIVNGIVTDDQSQTITSYGFQYGLTDSLGTTETITGSVDENTNFYKRLDSLTPGTVYYYRAFATNAYDTGYGDIERLATKGSPAVYEYYITGGDADSIDIYGNNWAYQTFTVSGVAHTITSVLLYVKRTGSPGDITVSIRHGSSDTPTGVDLVTATYDGDDVSTSYQWITVEFDDEEGYQTGEYAIVVRCLDGDGSNYIEWYTNSAGGYASGVYGTSADGGTTWTDTADDTIFEVWGNPCMEIQDVKVFNSYRESDDWLIVVRYINIYPPYYDTYDIRKYFTFDLLDLSSNVRGSTPLPAWGNRVGSLSLSADLVSGLEVGEAYTVRIYGLFGSNPYTDYELQPEDYQGEDLSNLDSWVISSAGVLSSYYNTSLTTYVSGRGELLNSTASTIFTNGISGLNTVRPDLFLVSSVPGGYTDTTEDQTGRVASPAATVGPQVWAWVSEVGSIVGAEGRLVLVILFVGIAFIIGIYAFLPGHSLAANILVIPMIAGAGIFGLDMIWIVIMSVIAGLLFVKHFWWDRRT